MVAVLGQQRLCCVNGQMVIPQGQFSGLGKVTCLQEGSRLDRPQLDRAADGTLRYAWKKNTPALGPIEQARLIKAGHLKREQSPLRLQDVETGKPVTAHRGSVCWNDHRRRWVMIATEVGGTSHLGEVWYA